MAVTVVVGGQFGSEGKGKVAYLIAREQGVAAAVRVGGPNSGHTAIQNGHVYRLQALPTAALLPDVDVVLPAGTYISIDTLRSEMQSVALDPARLHVDPNAMIITESLRKKEQLDEALVGIGSTLSGTGAAVVARIERSHVTLAKDVPDLKEFISDTNLVLRSHIARGERVLVEGTQGLGLSVYHSPYYPYCTSRDTSAAGVLSEAGLSPLDVDQVVLVLRAFPIRVAGPSGPLPREIDWSEVARISGDSEPLAEYTTVTRKLRRVALFDPVVPNKAISVNRPTQVVLNHVDYFDASCRSTHAVSGRAARHVAEIASQLSAPLTHVGLGPDHLLRLGASGND